ncbi:MAG: hypothetical protein HYU28_01610 [Actinobacteria bacterium]|nr:hypothetical protein [Actinomycetota bacterium]
MTSMPVALLAFGATAIASVFFESLLVRWSADRRPYTGAWTVALGLFALASAAFAVGASTGWDQGSFRAFYLFGAIVNVPWLALGTVYLLAPRAGLAARSAVLLFTGLATGAVLMAPIDGPLPSNAIPEGRDVFDAFPRILAAAGSGLGALVVFGGALWSAWRHFSRRDRNPRRTAANGLIALGTLVLSVGGVLEGVLGGADEAFATTLTAGIAIIYAGFRVALPRSNFGSSRPL